MFHSLFTIILLQFFSFSALLKDSSDSTAISNANISIPPPGRNTVSDASGGFRYENLPSGNYQININLIGYDPLQFQLDLQKDATLTLYLKRNKETLSQEVIVYGTRANSLSPIPQYNLNEKQISEKYYGHDVPTLLQAAPSVNSYSESGSGMGYSYLRIRGMDQTRINMSYNGIPLNDPQNQGVFFNNFSDLISGAKDIQVQRGAGTSIQGVASYAGSINMTAKDLAEKPEFQLRVGYGSYNSQRLTTEYQTGLLKNKFAFYGRLSHIYSDGYRKNSSNQTRSYAFSAAYFGRKSILRFNAFGGMAESQLAYVAASQKQIDSLGRNYNPLGKADKDAFNQHFMQLQYSYFANPKINFGGFLYYVNGNAPYFDIPSYGFYNGLNMPNAAIGNQTFTGSNLLLRYRLNQNLVGGMAFFNFKDNFLEINSGIHAHVFMSKHSMVIPWLQISPQEVGLNHLVYSNIGIKEDYSGFMKAKIAITPKFFAFADVQVRVAKWSYLDNDQPILRDTNQVDRMMWAFINPKIGVRYEASENVSLYASFAQTSREPTRDNIFGGNYLEQPLMKITQNILKPESVNDLEVGADFRTSQLKANLNAYYMQFCNEITPTGEYNAFGYALRQNVASSFRAGIEAYAEYQFLKKWSLSHSSAFSDNRIKQVSQYLEVKDDTGASLTYENYEFKNISPVLSPQIILNQGVAFQPWQWIKLGLNGRYVSKQFLDLSNQNSNSLPEYFVLDAQIQLKLDKLLQSKTEQTILFQLNNISNTYYSPSGSTLSSNMFLLRQAGQNDSLRGSGWSGYYVAAPINFFLTYQANF